MRVLIPNFFLLISLGFSQEIFNSFGLDGHSQYTGEAVYQFTTDKDVLLILKAHNVQGDIEIIGEPGNAVQIVERIELSSAKERWAKKEYELSRASVHYDDVNGMIKIVGANRWSSKVDYSYDIHVPKRTSIQFVNQGGDISCENIAGELDIQTGGGNIKLRRIAGKISANTAGGDIELAHALGNINLVTSGGNIETSDTEGVLFVETKGGDLEIEINHGNVEAYTSGGEIRLSDIDGNSVVVKTEGGDIEIHKVNSDIQMETAGGDLEISRVVGNVVALTNAGDIEIDNIIGDVNLKTMMGSIQGEQLGGRITAITNTGDIIIHKSSQDIVSQDIDITNSFGDVYLVVPRHFSAQYNVVIDGIEDSEMLDSEIPLVIQLEGMVLHANGVQGSGQHNVSISSHFGVVTISKD